MDIIFSQLPEGTLLIAFIIAFGAGLIKGIVGFALPMLLISGLSSFLEPQVALVGLMLPTLVTNSFQMLRHGVDAARQTAYRFRIYLIVGCLALVVSAQLYRFVDGPMILLMIGAFVLCFATLMILGWKPGISPERKNIWEAITGLVAGTAGGVSGVWGPPTVLYLTAIDTPKQEHIRAQGVAYALGAFILFFAHMTSGIITAPRLALSALLIIPAMAGMWLGAQISDRIDQTAFRKAALFVLLLAGANLIRRGLTG